MDLRKVIYMIRNLLLVFILVLHGCSDDINEGEGKGPSFSDERFQTNCKINSEEMAKILQEPIPEQINCIYDTLNLFMNLIEPERKELGKTLSRDVLERYIRTNEENAEDIIKYLDVFFSLNYLVFGTDYGYIKKDNFAKLKDFLILFNREFSSIYKYLEPYAGPVKIKSHNKIKESVLQAARNIVKDGMVLVEDPNKKNSKTSVNRSLKSLLEMLDKDRSLRISTILDYFKTDSNVKELEDVKKLLYIKKVILGGDPDIITIDEFVDLIENKLEILSEILFDVFKLKDIIFDTEEKKFALYEDSLSRFKKVLENQHDNPEVLITFDNIFTTLDTYRDQIFTENSDLDLRKYQSEMERIKEVLIGSTGDFTAKDILGVLDHLKEVAKIGVQFARAFQENKRILLDYEPVKGNELKNETGVEVEHFQNFQRIIEKYRYFKGDEILPLYSDKILRNIEGVIEVGQIEYLVDKLVRFYEKEYPCHLRGPHWPKNPYTGKKEEKILWDDYICKGSEDYRGTLKVGQVYFIILEFRRILNDLYIVLENREDRSAESVALMTDLFQHSSNDDGLIQINEIVEFAYQLLNSIEMSDNVLNYFSGSSRCPVIDEDDPSKDPSRSKLFKIPRYSVQNCFRPEFFNIFEEPFIDNSGFGFTYTYFDYFTKFKDYYKQIQNNQEEQSRLIVEMENFTRICPFENVPMSKSDILGVYAGLFNVEATLNRFDFDNDNVIEVGEELDAAFAHFKRAIDGLTDGIKPSARKIFDFLTNKKRIPNTIEGLGLIVGIAPKPKDADRLTLTKILVGLQEQSDKKRKERLGDLYVSDEEYCQSFLPIKNGVKQGIKPMQTFFADDFDYTGFEVQNKETKSYLLDYMRLKMSGL
ncbi:MAG: hypothetical protein H6621_10500 [Halobacteriovoraceae bacterium]|nr:hypothetical protein [Halobacteriovoraceae bacterium]MCB9095486.1 hypothetical protein [Halobacteriovoraceae bacterium]